VREKRNVSSAATQKRTAVATSKADRVGGHFEERTVILMKIDFSKVISEL
jgi:hypothetical protein